MSGPNPCPAHPLRAGSSLAEAVMHEVRQRLVVRGCKWDPQVGDQNTLASFPLLMGRGEWTRLAELSTKLAEETLAFERAVLEAPRLIRKLGLPEPLQLLSWAQSDLCTGARVMRFDFHFTAEGWRLSEVNSDVPGGYAEASLLPREMAAAIGEGVPAGDPAAALAGVLAEAAAGRPVALLAPVGYLEDWQVVCFLRRLLLDRGVEAWLGAPEHLQMGPGRFPQLSLRGTALNVVHRFFLAQWLPGLGNAWYGLFAGSATQVVNPGVSVLSESKRMPLVRAMLGLPMPAWEGCLPETRDPGEVPWQQDSGWLVKAALSDTGESVAWRGGPQAGDWKAFCDRVEGQRGQWVAQRRFETLAVETPAGPMYPCVGVYVIEGQVQGAYLRLSHGPVVDYRAVDAALLIVED